MKKLIFAAAVFMLLSTLIIGVSAEERSIVSGALTVLAAKTDMAKTALVGEDISFSEEDFGRSLNLSDINTVTLERVPELTEGRLVIGSATLAAGQSISGENLDMLKFVPASGEIRQSGFDFSTGEGYSIRCNIYFVDKMNYSPTISLASDNALAVNTHDMVSRIGKLDAYDPDGDKFVYEIVSYPENGSLVLLDRDEGRYVYTPKGDFTGNDSFSYVARDIYGNYSASASVSVTVRERRSSVTFGDIDDCNVYNAALSMAENSLMAGTEIDGVTYFSPDQSITRAEFLAVAMRAAGITDPGNVGETVFDDDADIPGEYKGYISAAYQMGFINGSEIDGKTCFLPNATVTRAEAAVMLNSIISSDREVEKPVVLPVFADSSELPHWASDAIYSMNSMGVLPMLDGYASPEAVVTRGDAAQMFEAVMNLYE
ncbi:MAG: S-layer homology domain-containing protein [Clostridia bacterium]|nr:S-layer homology domain-containing protein [Clostridia bacterium]